MARRRQRFRRVNAEAVTDQAFESFPSFTRQRERMEKLDAWYHTRQQETLDGEGPFAPPDKEPTPEYKDLATRSPASWAQLVVTTTAQTAFIDGVRAPGSQDNLAVWDIWQENGWDARQGPVFRGALAHGLSWVSVLPGVAPLTGDKTARMRGISALNMAGFYDEDDDEWPLYTLYGKPQQTRDLMGNVIDSWAVRLYDETAIHYLTVDGDGTDRRAWTYISSDAHEIGVPPIVRYYNVLDLEGRATGEIEPHIPLLRRIDQTTFDRLIVQRFGAWKVRYATGLAKPETDEEKRAAEILLKVGDLLVSSEAQSKFGTLDATDLGPLIEAHASDLRDLSAVTQTPPHHMLGLSSNMQAESLAAVEAGAKRKGAERKVAWGESAEQQLRLAAHVKNIPAEARMFNMQVRWRDTESRSLVQVATALALFADKLQVPVEMLWEQIPQWTDGDTERAKALVGSGALERLLAALERQAAPVPTPTQQPPVPPAPPNAA